MIIGLEFDANGDFVVLRSYADAEAGRRWVRSSRRDGHSRSLYEVSGQGLHVASRETIVTRTLRKGRLLLDTEIAA